MVKNLVGSFLREERFRRGISLGTLASNLGATSPKSMSRRCNRIVAIERGELFDAELISRITASLELDQSRVATLVEEEKEAELQAWQIYVNTTVPPVLHIKPFSGFWFRQSLPDDFLGNEALTIDYARTVSENNPSWTIELAVNRRLTYLLRNGQIEGRIEAKPGQPNAPYMTIGKHQEIQFVASPEVFKP
jgi:hypothetical protein